MSSYDTGLAFDRDGKQIREFKGEADHFANFLKAVRSRKHEDLNADIEEGHLSSACATWAISRISSVRACPWKRPRTDRRHRHDRRRQGDVPAHDGAPRGERRRSIRSDRRRPS